MSDPLRLKDTLARESGRFVPDREIKRLNDTIQALTEERDEWKAKALAYMKRGG